MKKEKKEKIPHMCESIDHRPLRGRCPKTRRKTKDSDGNAGAHHIASYILCDFAGYLALTA